MSAKRSDRSVRPTRGPDVSSPDALTDVEERLALDIIAHVPVAVWAASGKKHGYAVRLWSHGAEALYGYSRREMLGANYIETIVADLERTQAMADHAKLEATREPYRNLAMDIGADGRQRMLLTQGFALWHPELEHYLQGEVAVDVTQVATEVDWLARVRRAETHQVVTRQFLDLAKSALSSSIADVIAIASDLVREYVDGDGQVQVWRETASGRLEQEEGSGAPSDSLEYAEQALIRWAISARQSRAVDYANYLPPTHSGSPHTPTFPRRLQVRDRPASFVVAPLDNGGRAYGGVLVHFRPSTTLNDAAIDVVNMAAWGVTLAYDQAERVAGLQHEGALAAKERERLAVLRLSRQYMHAVAKKAAMLTLIADKLQRDPSSTEVERALEPLRAIADDVMAVGEEFQGSLEPGVVDLSELLTSLCGAFALTFDEISVEKAIEPDLKVHGVRPFLEGAFENLLLNAAEAMGNRGRVSVWTSKVGRSRRTGPTVRVLVTDDGPGMSEWQVAHAGREPFSTKGEGRGLGLSITLTSIEEAGGTWAYRTGGRGGLAGACWEITLPLISRRRPR